MIPKRTPKSGKSQYIQMIDVIWPSNMMQTCIAPSFSNLTASHGQLIKPEGGMVVFAVIAKAN